MSDEYLWNGSGDPDPGVVRAERLLAPLRRPLPELARRQPRATNDETTRQRADETTTRRRNNETTTRRRADETTSRRPGVRFYVPGLAAAAAILLMLGALWRDAARMPSWDVERLAGQPRIETAPVDGTGRLAVGQTLVTDGDSRARMDIDAIGQVVVDTDTHVRLVETRRGRHKLSLDRGTLHAFITAPPGQFVVDTPSSTATDLGCVYTLHVDEDGTGLLSVAAGWVAFEYKGRESFVPAGASALTRRTGDVSGPGTPRYDDAGEAFKTALDRVDRASDAAARSGDLGYVLEHARPRDAMTLWHLIARVGPRERTSVVDALAARTPMPAGVTRDAVLTLDRSALDRWWDSLGLQEAGWWRKWKQERIW